MSALKKSTLDPAHEALVFAIAYAQKPHHADVYSGARYLNYRLGGMEIMDLEVWELWTWRYRNYGLGGKKIMDLEVWELWTWRYGNYGPEGIEIMDLKVWKLLT